jgi:hypothetical protein
MAPKNNPGAALEKLDCFASARNDAQSSSTGVCLAAIGTAAVAEQIERLTRTGVG